MIEFEEYIADFNIKYKKMYLRDRFKYYLYLPYEALVEIYSNYLEDCGVGENLIELTDTHRDHVSLEHLKDLFSFSKFHWEFLEKIEEVSGDFAFSLQGEWFTWFEGEKLVFGEVHSLDSYLKILFIEESFKYMKEVIPHSITYGVWQKTRTQSEEILTYDAEGREEELINWKIEVNYFLEAHFNEFIKPYLSFEGVFRLDEWDEAIIVVSEEVADKIRFSSFISDINLLLLDPTEYLEEMRKLFREVLDELKEKIRQDN